MNQELQKLLREGEDGHRLSLKMRNSYMCDDGLAVHTYTDDRTCTISDAKAQVCKAALVELLLRAPNRGSVRLLDRGQLTRNGWSVEGIWDEVRRIQLQMHGISGISEAPPMGGAGINAAPPPASTHGEARHSHPALSRAETGCGNTDQGISSHSFCHGAPQSRAPSTCHGAHQGAPSTCHGAHQGGPPGAAPYGVEQKKLWLLVWLLVWPQPWCSQSRPCQPHRHHQRG